MLAGYLRSTLRFTRSGTTPHVGIVASVGLPRVWWWLADCQRAQSLGRSLPMTWQGDPMPKKSSSAFRMAVPSHSLGF